MSNRPHPRTLDEAGLVFRCIERPPDEDAWFEFWGRYSFAVRSAVRPLLVGNPHQEVADAVQAAFLKIFENLSHYDPKLGPLIPFLRQIARNTVLDGLRRNRRQFESTVELSDEIAAALAAAPLLMSPVAFAEAMHTELMKVKDAGRLKAYQMLIEGADAFRVGNELGVSPAGVYRLRRECLDLVRQGLSRSFQTEY